MKKRDEKVISELAYKALIGLEISMRGLHCADGVIEAVLKGARDYIAHRDGQRDAVVVK